MDQAARQHAIGPRWLRGCAAIATIFLVAALASCALLGAGVRRGMVRTPTATTRVGPGQLVALQTLTPDCALAFPCGRPINIRDPKIERYYVVWVLLILPDGSGETSIRKFRLLMEPVSER